VVSALCCSHAYSREPGAVLAREEHTRGKLQALLSVAADDGQESIQNRLTRTNHGLAAGGGKGWQSGPIGQAHFVEDVYPPVKGGAFKSSEDAPFIEDWSCVAAGAFTELID